MALPITSYNSAIVGLLLRLGSPSVAILIASSITLFGSGSTSGLRSIPKAASLRSVPISSLNSFLSASIQASIILTGITGVNNLQYSSSSKPSNSFRAGTILLAILCSYESLSASVCTARLMTPYISHAKREVSFTYCGKDFPIFNEGITYRYTSTSCGQSKATSSNVLLTTCSKNRISVVPSVVNPTKICLPIPFSYYYLKFFRYHLLSSIPLSFGWSFSFLAQRKV